MSRTTLILAMAGLTAAVAWRAWAATGRIAAGKESPTDWRVGLMGAVLGVQGVLFMNALAFVGAVQVAAIEEPGRTPLLESQLALLLGTGGLMLLVARGLDAPGVADAPDPGAAVGRAFGGVLGGLMVRFWLAAAGVGLVFGVRAPGVALLLAVELTLVWGVGRLAVRRSGRRAPAAVAAAAPADD